MTKKILLLPGDGIGAEVVDSAKAVLQALSTRFPDATYEFQEAPIGVAALKAGNDPLPETTIEAVKSSDGCLLGAVDEAALPKGTSALGRFRRRLQLYANVRPLRAYAGVACLCPDLDIVVVRENSEGMYSGTEYAVGTDAACAVRIITREGSRRIAKVAFELAASRRKRLTVVHKLGAFKMTDGLFLECVREVGKSYPGVALDPRNIDAAAMDLIQHPGQFDVILATNMFGDILSDEIAGLVGGLGLAASSVLGDKYGYFEPVHGSAPDIAGKGIANPMATILSAAMLVDHLGQKKAAAAIGEAVTSVLAAGKVRTPDLKGKSSTQDVTRAVIDQLMR
ncbi:MAG: isocitrate/isopropylmalate dehydrogenase family protein [Elusimicrobia bacterium]|nr:isocitrate/isopropylmalate dehydrogenase family protein [Elusimicrobiota bacterium]